MEHTIEVIDFADEDIMQDPHTYNSECVICLDKFEEEGETSQENIRQTVLLLCGHKFHYDCIQQTFTTQIRNNFEVTCPVCRKQLLDKESPLYIQTRQHIVPQVEQVTQEQHQQDVHTNLTRFKLLMVALIILLVFMSVLFIGVLTYYSVI